MSHFAQQDQTAAHSHDKELIPRFMVLAVGALMLSTLAIVTYARVTDMPLSATPPEGAVLMARDVVLSGDLDGSAAVHAADGSLIADLPPEQGGFISGIYRVIRRERVAQGVALDTPVAIEWHDTGRVSITDPATGWSADLMGFGADNARAVARLLAQ